MSSVAFAQDFQTKTIRHDGIEREYRLFVPDSIAPERPLVIMLHGYGGKAENYRPEMTEIARKNGFVLCVPQGCKAPKGKTGWNVGYPAQEGMMTDDVDFVCKLKRSLVKDLNLNKLNCFLCGMSNGGEMCYLTALQRPEDGENTLPSRLPLRKYLFLNNGIDPSLAAFVLKQHNEFELTVASSFTKTALLDQIVGIPAQHV